VIKLTSKSGFTAIVGMLALAMALPAPAGTGGTKSATSPAPPYAPLPAVVYFSRQEVDANFEHHKGKDESLYDSDYGTQNFKIKTSHREKPTRAEVHLTYTDVVYVVKGSATLITGGKLVDIITPATYPDGRPFSQDEIWGRSIEGGESRHVSEGDVIVIPNGVPHWFSEIGAPFWFYNVKVK
jgi:mannose-6-phosphate isomerase-like protein (cupin superfamily)